MANQSIARGAAILSLFSISRPRLKLSQIAEEIGLPLSTTNGLVQSLGIAGFLEKNEDNREYQLGLWNIELGATKMATSEINQKGSALAYYLGRDTGLTARLGVLERDAIVMTYCSAPSASILSRIDIPGTPLPTYCVSLGLAILAFSPEEEVVEHLNRIQLVEYTEFTKTDPQEILDELGAIRNKGYAFCENTLVMHATGIGAPILGSDGLPVGGINISGDSTQFTATTVDSLARQLMETASGISQQMGYRSYEPVFNIKR